MAESKEESLGAREFTSAWFPFSERTQERMMRTVFLCARGVQTPRITAVQLRISTYPQRALMVPLPESSCLQSADFSRFTIPGWSRFVASKRIDSSWEMRFVMEHGGTPFRRVEPCACGAVSKGFIARHVMQAAAGILRSVHEHGMIHMDVHADNVLLCVDDAISACLPSKSGAGNKEECRRRWENAIKSSTRVIDFGSSVSLDPGTGLFRGDTRGGRWDLMHASQFADHAGAPRVSCGPRVDLFACGAMAIAYALGRDGLFTKDTAHPEHRGIHRYSQHPLRHIPTLRAWANREVEGMSNADRAMQTRTCIDGAVDCMASAMK